MLFHKFVLSAVLALASAVASQVVVTVTETVTVVTVTVPALSTSTSTKWVTVSSPSPTSQKPTVTATVTVTVAPPSLSTAITTCPIPLYYQCGGRNWKGCTYCAAGATCAYGNEFYYQCQATSADVATVTSTIYHGWPTGS